MAGSAPPRRLTTERLAIRVYEPEDAPLLQEAVESSLDHLRPFMAWAWEAPEPVEVIAERLHGFREQFEHGENYTYGLFALDETELLGGAGLHPRVGPAGSRSATGSGRAALGKVWRRRRRRR